MRNKNIVREPCPSCAMEPEPGLPRNCIAASMNLDGVHPGVIKNALAAGVPGHGRRTTEPPHQS